MNLALNIDASNNRFAIVGIVDDADPGVAGFTFIKLFDNPGGGAALHLDGSLIVEGPWFSYDQSADKIEVLSERASLPLQLLLMAYYMGISAAQTNRQGVSYTSAQNGQVSHLPTSAPIQMLGQKVLAYHAATPATAAAMPEIPAEPDPPVQDEQDSIDQLDRELAGLDAFLTDVRGHTGGNL